MTKLPQLDVVLRICSFVFSAPRYLFMTAELQREGKFIKKGKIFNCVLYSQGSMRNDGKRLWARYHLSTCHITEHLLKASVATMLPLIYALCFSSTRIYFNTFQFRQ